MPAELAVLLIGAAILAAVALVVWLRFRRSRRRLPGKVSGIRVELAAPFLASDQIVEGVWEVPVLMSNPTRAPQRLLLLGERAMVRTKRARYTATLQSHEVWLDADGVPLELNPAGTVTGYVAVTLPRGEVPEKVSLYRLGPQQVVLSGRVSGA